jgi:hypothetical protein
VQGVQVGLGANYRDKTYSDTTNVTAPAALSAKDWGPI